eukprot:Partr_v1_DN25096_c0_g1_i1_m51006 putative Immature colon carcinoma transcript 1
MIRLFHSTAIARYAPKFTQTPDQREAIEWARTFSRSSIPIQALDISYSRSGGPGGQNVNKLATKVEMRFQLSKASWIPVYVRDYLRLSDRVHVTPLSDEYRITCSVHRSQNRNYEECLEKICTNLLDAVRSIPSDTSYEQSRRVISLQTASDNRRLLEKKKASQKKASRRIPRE